MTRMYNGYQDLIEAFTIFMKYDKSKFPENFAAEHDVIYAGPYPVLVSKEDRYKLKDLGWYIDKKYRCFRFYT